MKRPSNRFGSGFTIVEILVVVIIIGVLAALIAPKFFGRIGQAKQSVAVQKLTEIEKAIDMFRLDYGRFPETLDELVTQPSDIPAEKWRGAQIKKKDLIDPWDREFHYRYLGEPDKYELYTLGADGEEGGEGENADITNADE